MISALTMLLLPLGLYMVSSLVSSMLSLGVWPDLPPMKAQMDIMRYAMSLGLREGITPIGIIISGFDSNMKGTLLLSARQCLGPFYTLVGRSLEIYEHEF